LIRQCTLFAKAKPNDQMSFHAHWRAQDLRNTHGSIATESEARLLFGHKAFHGEQILQIGKGQEANYRRGPKGTGDLDPKPK
jgi:hypothetical protein